MVRGMSELMTDEEFDAEFGRREANSPHSGAMFAAREAGRARSSEVAKDAVIKALADALVAMRNWRAGQGANKEVTKVQADAALRLAGRLP